MELLIRIEYEGKDIVFEMENGATMKFDPFDRLGLNFGFWECISALIVLGIGLRLFALVCLKLLVRKFQ